MYFVAIELDLWWIKLNVDVAVGFIECICVIEECGYFFIGWDWCF